MQRTNVISPPEYRQLLPYFAKRFVPLLVVSLVLVVIYYRVDVTHERRQSTTAEVDQVALAVNGIRADIGGVIAELRYLADRPALQHYFATGSEEARLAVQAEFIDFARHIKRYQQLRWLDLQGQEQVRVNVQDGSVFGVTKGELQDKSQRYYYREAVALTPGSVYLSPLDLNVEHGEIERPYRPMLRLAIATVDAEGVRNGLMILNYDAKSLLNNFARLDRGGAGEIQLLNNAGFWLHHPNSKRTFSFMFGAEDSFAVDFPQEWEAMRRQRNGQLRSGRGLFTFANLGVRELAGDAYGDDESWEHTVGPSPGDVVVVSHLDTPFWQRLDASHVKAYGAVLVVFLIASGIIVWRLARAEWQKEQLQDRLELHARVMETATNGVIITDADQVILSVNRGFTELTGYSVDEVVGKTPLMLASGRHDAAFYEEMWRALSMNGRWEGEIWNRHKSGEVYPEWLSISAIKDHHGNVCNYIGLFSVLSQQQSTESRLRELANSDPLTGLINRNLLYDRAEQAVSQARRHEHGVAFLFLDLDGFKPINDELGHAAGDMVLRQVAKRLRQCVRESDTVARFGGDEFVLLLPSIDSRKAVTELAQKVLDTIASEITVSGAHCRVGVSIGISLYPSDGVTIEALLNAADQAMYRAKEAGRHRYHFADEV